MEQTSRKLEDGSWEHTCRSCGVVFIVAKGSAKGIHLRRYCDEHYVGNTGTVPHTATNRKPGSCPQCGNRIPVTRGKQAVYCSQKCSIVEKDQRQTESRRQAAALAGLGADEAYRAEMSRRGPIYVELKRHPQLIRDMTSGRRSQVSVAEELATTPASISRAMDSIRYDVALAKKKGVWELPSEAAALIPVEALERLKQIGPDHIHTPGLVAECAAAFWEFEREFFTIGSSQDLFIVKAFHREIIDEMIGTFVFASRLLVLTPPRHGKSELVIRFVAWIIIMYPNIQILWVAANRDLAIQMTTKLKATFEHNELLAETFLPPDSRFGDKGCTVWQKNEFTLYTRTDHTLKSPTFTGLGSTATVAGRDADYIGIDDLEERKTVATSALREKSRQKHSEIMERQELQTGVVTIASRQHTEDIPNHLMAEEGEDAWKILTYTAHDEVACTVLDPEDYEAHVDCVLMPEIRPYRWLMARESESIALGLPGRFSLRYLQVPVPESGIVFDMKVIKDLCLDRSRGLGMAELPAMRLVGGLDPAARGTQVAFLWGWDGTTLHMIDYTPQVGGSVMGAVQIMVDWAVKYDLKLWIHEDNSGQIDAWRHVQSYIDVIEKHDLIVKPHTTGMNKHDPESGISSMASWYHTGRISLPYGTGEARRKTHGLLRQLELWTTDGLSKKGKTDIKMAHWLPFPTISKWSVSANEIRLVRDEEGSYPGVTSFSQAPWAETQYPGG